MPSKKEFDPSDLNVNEKQVLGRGGAGNVYKGTLVGARGPRAVAVKVLEGDPKSGEAPEEFLLLEKALKGCKYVCKPLGYCMKDGKMCMVLHLYEKSLSKYIRERSGLPCHLHGAARVAFIGGLCVVRFSSRDGPCWPVPDFWVHCRRLDMRIQL